MKKQLLLGMAVCGLALVPFESKAEATIVNYMNSAPEYVILPSSHWNPSEIYEATIWNYKSDIHNTNDDHELHNKILATPADDAQGRKWYETDYELTENENFPDVEWTVHTSPFYDSGNSDVTDEHGYAWADPYYFAEFYGRRTFTLTEALPAENIILACGHDDAPCEYYINGVQVFAYDVWSNGWNNGHIILLSDEHKALIKTDGTPNVLAFHVHQNWGGAFADCGLYKADMKVEDAVLPSLQNKNENWPCEYFFPLDMDDVDYFEGLEWYKPGYDISEVEGCEWLNGVGPLGNDSFRQKDENGNDMKDEDGNDLWMMDENNDYVRGWHIPASRWLGDTPIFVRRYFNLTEEDLEALNNGEMSIVFTCSYDENPKAYINGEHFWEAANWNDNNYASHTLTAEQIANLKEGENMLAMSLSNGAGGAHIDMGFKTSKTYVPTADGVESVAVNNKLMNDNRIFDLQGRFVGTEMDKLGRGIYIQGGKKVLINK